MTVPSVGRIVHYVSYGTPGGEYASQCRAAIITDTSPGLLPEVGRPGGDEHNTVNVVVGLCVLNPTGQFFNHGVAYDDGGERTSTIGGRGHGRQTFVQARSGPYLCNGRQYCGGTWHWPERVEEEGDR